MWEYDGITVTLGDDDVVTISAGDGMVIMTMGLYAMLALFVNDNLGLVGDIVEVYYQHHLTPKFVDMKVFVDNTLDSVVQAFIWRITGG